MASDEIARYSALKRKERTMLERRRSSKRNRSKERLLDEAQKLRKEASCLVREAILKRRG